VKTAFPVIVLGANGYAFFQGNWLDRDVTF
jgi:hypothetical protein